MRHGTHAPLLAWLINLGHETMDSVIEAMQAAVARVETVEGSAKEFIAQCARQVAALPNQDAATRALVERLNASNDALAAAITANTRAGQPVVPDAPVTPESAKAPDPVPTPPVAPAAPAPTPAPDATVPTPATTTPDPADPNAPKT